MSDLNFEKPQIIEELNVDVIMEEMKSQMIEIAPEFTAYLESDPLIKLMEVCAYREFILRQRINNAACANLLAFATGSDLDQLGLFYDVVRFENEDDEKFRIRINAKIQGWNTAGSRESYEYFALQADPKVKEAAAYSPEVGLVKIALLSTENGGVASEELVANVKQYVTQDHIKTLTDTVEVVACDIISICIQADITLMSGTPPEVLNTLKKEFTDKFEAFVGLGVNVSKSWIISNLFGSGVQDVKLISPLEDVIVSEIGCAKLIELDLRQV